MALKVCGLGSEERFYGHKYFFSKFVLLEIILSFVHNRIEDDAEGDRARHEGMRHCVL